MRDSGTSFILRRSLPARDMTSVFSLASTRASPESVGLESPPRRPRERVVEARLVARTYGAISLGGGSREVAFVRMPMRSWLCRRCFGPVMMGSMAVESSCRFILPNEWV